MRIRSSANAVACAVLVFSVAGCSMGEQTAQEAYDMGIYWYNNARFVEAMNKFDDAVRLDPSYFEAKLAQANTARELGNIALGDKERKKGDQYHGYAEEKLKALLAQNGSDARVHHALGQLYYERFSNGVANFTVKERLQYRESALACFRKVSELSPDDIYVHKYLGLLLITRTKEDVPSGKEHLTKFLDAANGVLVEMKKVEPRTRDELNYMRTQIGLLQGQIDDIQAIIKETP